MLASAGEGGRDFSTLIETLQGKEEHPSPITPTFPHERECRGEIGRLFDSVRHDLAHIGIDEQTAVHRRKCSLIAVHAGADATTYPDGGSRLLIGEIELVRSEERSVGRGCVRTCSFGWS